MILKQKARHVWQSRTNQITICTILLLFCSNLNISSFAQNPLKTVHVFVALCDNKNQGIVPVPSKLGNGEDPKNNLYWGALYGVKTFFKKSRRWKLLSVIQKPEEVISERCIFKHKTSNVYLIADAYRGIEIKQAIKDFLQSASGGYKKKLSAKADSEVITLKAGGASGLLAYVGHNGLMDFKLLTYPGYLRKKDKNSHEAIILACASKYYFSGLLRKSGAKPLLWTTGLMAPEAYTLENAVEGWILNESDENIRLRAAKAYNKYQKCGLRAAKKLFATGF